MYACVELWAVSSGPSGWQAGYATLAGLQPTGTDTHRAQAIRRVGGLARYIDIETGNLREGGPDREPEVIRTPAGCASGDPPASPSSGSGKAPQWLERAREAE